MRSRKLQLLFRDQSIILRGVIAPLVVAILVLCSQVNLFQPVMNAIAQVPLQPAPSKSL